MNYYTTIRGTLIDENNKVISLDNSDYIQYLIDGGTVEQKAIIIEEEKQDMIEQLRAEYSVLISNIEGMDEAVQRKLIDGTEIPQEIIDKREILKKEYKIKESEIINLS